MALPGLARPEAADDAASMRLAEAQLAYDAAKARYDSLT